MQDHQRYFPVRDAHGEAAALVHHRHRTSRAAIRRRSRPATSAWCARASPMPRSSIGRPPAAASTRGATPAHVTFQAQLGSMDDKTERVRGLARADRSRDRRRPGLADRAAQLSKLRPAPYMVGEFPELQGIMGRYYALHDGEHAEVAEALREHYLPRGAGDALPARRTGIAVALADKLDTLAGIFAIGQKPTGTRDPFALRRAALGLLRTSIERGSSSTCSSSSSRRSRSQPVKAPEDRARPKCTTTSSSGCAPITSKAAPASPSRRRCSTPCWPPARLRPLDFDARLRALAAFLQLPEPRAWPQRTSASPISCARRPSRSARRSIPSRLIDPAEQILAEQVAAIARQVEPTVRGARLHAGAPATGRAAQGSRRFLRRGHGHDRRPGAAREPSRAARRMRGLFMRAADLSRLPG